MRLRINLREILSVVFTTGSRRLVEPNPGSSKPNTNQPAARTLNILVSSDSILWSEGLRTENKAWYHVKLWLEKNAGHQVTERIEAHAGEVIKKSSIADNFTSTNAKVSSNIIKLFVRSYGVFLIDS
jgi:hypothetical protein